jgi:hypothetical protein
MLRYSEPRRALLAVAAAAAAIACSAGAHAEQGNMDRALGQLQDARESLHEAYAVSGFFRRSEKAPHIARSGMAIDYA